eukprot:UN15128
MSVWDYLTGKVEVSPRTTIVHDHTMFTDKSRQHGCGAQTHFHLPGYDSLGSIRVGKYKLIVGSEKFASWYGWFSPNTTTPPDLSPVACQKGPCLFDIENDPGEHVDLSSDHPEIVP